MKNAEHASAEAEQAARIHLRKPQIIMICALALCIGLAALLAATALSFSTATDRAQFKYSVAHELGAEIVYRDEVLTMSALMAASSGETAWVDRYYTNVAILDDVLEQTRELGATGFFALDGLDQINEANEELVSIESDALSLATSGANIEATELLSTDRYVEAKAEYSNGIATLSGAIDSGILSAKETDRRNASVALGLSIAAGLGALLLSVMAWRSLTIWRQRRMSALAESDRADHVQRSALSEMRVQLEHLAENSNLDWWQIDAEGNFLTSHGLNVDAIEPHVHLARTDEPANVFEIMADYPEVVADIRRALRGEVINKRVNVGDRALQSVYIPDIRDGDVKTVMGISTDISAEWHLQRELQHQASHDSLTGFLNRSGFEQEVDSVLTDTDSAGSMMLLDVSGLRAVNDLRGHEVGDRALAAIAERMRRLVGESGVCARIGGAEFCVFVPHLDGAQTDAFAAQVAECVSKPIADPTGPIELKATVGFDGPTLHARTFRGELPALDVALGEARAASLTVARFLPNMMTDFAAEMTHRKELADAIEQRHLHVAFQPIWDAATGRIRGAEALARWTHPERGPVAPGEFIPRAERAGLIRELDRLILEQACEQLATWQRSDPALAGMRLAINLSAEDLTDASLCGRIEALCHVHGLAAQDLLFELTESTALENLHVAQDRLAELQQLGCQLALDDFGTGYSSLSQLQNLAVDVLKVDRSFVSGESANQRELCEMIVGLAKLLDLQVVAEGVETSDQLDTIRRLGCDYVQGFLLAKPLPAEEFAELVIRLGETSHQAFAVAVPRSARAVRR